MHEEFFEGEREVEHTNRRMRLHVESPSETDNFKAQSHQRLANVIVELVEDENSFTGQILGLEGSWGSGKSTVVQLISNHFKASKVIKTIIFDAWAHQGDPLRRSFLETVIENLRDTEWLSKKDADYFLEQLAGKVTNSRTTNKEFFTTEGKLFSFSVLLVPIGSVLVTRHFAVHGILALFLGLSFLLAPLILLLFLSLGKWFGARVENNHERGFRFRLSQIKPFDLIVGKPETSKISVSVERGEPTSLEFEKMFKKLLAASLNPKRRLLIVLDNLDRIDSGDARSVLSTMQTFMMASKSWSSPSLNIWMLIPYDPSGLERIWGDHSLESIAAENDDFTQYKYNSSSAAFMEKIFQVRMEAPPLVLSDWRNFLVELLKYSLPDVEEDQFHTILKLKTLYQAHLEGDVVLRQSPTPRQLKQFVNKIAILYKQTFDISLISIAYFVLLRQANKNIVKLIFENGTRPDNLIYILTSTVDEDLAALHFGTDKTMAQQLLIRPALQEALAQENWEAIVALKDRVGFDHVVKSLHLEGTTDDGGIELTSALVTLDEAGVFTLKSLEDWFVRDVVPNTVRVSQWALSGRNSGIGLARIFAKILDHETLSLSDLLARVSQHPRDPSSGRDTYIEGAAGLADELFKMGLPLEEIRIHVEIPSEHLARSLAYYGREITVPESKGGLNLNRTPTEVALSLAAGLTGSDYGDFPEVMNIVIELPQTVDWDAFWLACLSWLKSQDPVDRIQLQAILGTCDFVRSQDADKSLLGSAADEGILLNLMGMAIRNDFADSAAAASMLHLDSRPQMLQPTAIRDSGVAFQTLTQLLENPLSFPKIFEAQFEWLLAHNEEAFEFLLKISANSRFKPWVNAHLVKLSESLSLIVSAEQFLTSWVFLRNELPVERFHALELELLRQETCRSFFMNHLHEPAVAFELMAATLPVSDEFDFMKNWIAEIFRSAGAAEWSACLMNPNGGPLLDLALRMLPDDLAIFNLAELNNPLHTHYRALLEGSPVWTPSRDNFDRFMRMVGDDARNSLASDIAAALEGKDGKIPNEFLETYGTFLAGEGQFRTHAKLPNFIARAVANDQWETVDYIHDTANSHSDVLEAKGRDREMENLRDVLKQKASELRASNLPIRDSLSGLLRFLGFEIEESDV